LEPVAKKAVVSHLQVKHNLSERRACRLVRLSRSIYRYAAQPRDDSEMSESFSGIGFAPSGVRIQEDVSNASPSRTFVESQASLSRLLLDAAEPKAQA
jgi:hypothetical protein